MAKNRTRAAEPAGPAGDAWETANTFAAIGEAMAAWLEGSLDYRPHYGIEPTPPAAETAGLIPALAAMCRGGFITDSSQPGMTSANALQRAYVSGLCSSDTLRAIEGAVGDTELVVLVTSPPAPPVHDPGQLVPVTRTRKPSPGLRRAVPRLADGTWAQTWLGPATPAEDILTGIWDPIPHDGRRALAWSASVDVIDPVWGRNDLLWPTLAGLFPPLS